MQAYDILMLIVLALAIVWGAWKGLAWQIASIASIGAELFRRPALPAAAGEHHQRLAAVEHFSVDADPVSGTGLIVWIGFNLISEMIERVKLKEFDRQLGALFGAAKGVLLCVLDYAVFGRAAGRRPAAGNLQFQVGLLHCRAPRPGRHGDSARAARGAGTVSRPA